jgi:hypothetical protein
LSFLTKLFVVLHVVLTLLFVSATIVWVNRVEDFRKTNGALSAQLSTAQQQAQSALNEAQTARGDALAVRQQVGAEIDRARKERDDALTEVRERDTLLAQLQQNLASADARAQASTSGLETAMKTNSLLQDQLNQSRETGNKIQQQNTELLTDNSDLRQKLTVATRQIQNANEEIEELRTQVAGGAGTGPAGGQQIPGAAPTPNANEIAVNGIVRDRRNVNGVNYATISVGASDNVRKGMVFNVIDREAGDFLGYLTVDRVEPRESSGRLEGPRVTDVKAGNEVRTQL